MGDETRLEVKDATIAEIRRNSLSKGVRIANQLIGKNVGGGVVLIGGAVDATLRDLMKAALMPSAKLSKTLFEGPSAAFGTFSGRIAVSSALRLIDPDVAAGLQGIRKARNVAAHPEDVVAFAQISDHVKPLVSTFEGSDTFNRAADLFSSKLSHAGDDVEAWARFSAAGLCMVQLLEMNRACFVTLGPMPLIGHLPTQWPLPLIGSDFEPSLQK